MGDAYVEGLTVWERQQKPLWGDDMETLRPDEERKTQTIIIQVTIATTEKLKTCLEGDTESKGQGRRIARESKEINSRKRTTRKT